MTLLQNKLLEMLTWLDSFIRKHELTYFGVGGTLIGAARHQGFIPWDDDIDIAMPRNDYNKLCELLKQPIEHYVIETPDSENKDFLYTFAKFYDINTSMTELLRTKVHRGVYIDIFPLDGLGDNLEEALKNYRVLDLKNMFLMTRTCAYRKDRKWYKNAAIFCSRIIPKCFINEKKMVIDIDKLNQKYSYDNCDYIGITMSTYREKAIYKKSLFGEPTELPFENIKILVPVNYDEYLTATYGDWKTLPPVEKRKSAHDFIELDFDKPYMSINK